MTSLFYFDLLLFIYYVPCKFAVKILPRLDKIPATAHRVRTPFSAVPPYRGFFFYIRFTRIWVVFFLVVWFRQRSMSSAVCLYDTERFLPCSKSWSLANYWPTAETAVASGYSGWSRVFGKKIWEGEKGMVHNGIRSACAR